MNDRTIAIAVAGKSEIKFGSVEDADAALGRQDHIFPEPNAKSGINEQPYGRRETCKGAKNRARAVHELHPTAYAVAVENGIVRQNRGYVDLAYVVVITPSGKRFIGCSEAVPVPEELVTQSRNSDWTVTAGQLEFERKGCDDHANPHIAWGGKDRWIILTETVRQVLLAAIEAEVADIPNIVRVEIAGISCDLNVRQVVSKKPGRVPGIHLGILKLIGDAELTETVGIALAKLVPDDVEAIVMPDGKAQTLLHVVQRELSRRRGTLVPAVLARKEQKSYMEEPIVSTLSSSITTTEKYRFYLDGDDIEVLQGRKVLLIDDVVSTGSTYVAMRELLFSEEVGVAEIVEAAVATEGAHPRQGVTALTNLKVFLS